ncbi:helix-turn-helix transcriptional regulator [Ornithinimicrobium cavernae]|uniref:helix-turn-helix transcriptional regulator n=1 Tax=Ornithinimicrobium cavernae TaxID=2666047 RepID=UPI000D69C4C9|nr:LuxR family transcriptional regulator [Ornithinimicrobium cavernae]
MDLTVLGLSADEGALYLLLVDRPAATAQELAQEWAPGDGGSVASVLAALEAKGLVTTLTGRPMRHAAVVPDVALDNLARAREDEIARVRAQAVELSDRWRRVGRATVPEELIEIVVGREATLQRSEQIQRSATQEVLIIDTPPYAAEDLGNPLESQLLAAGSVGYRCLYDRSALEIPGKLRAIRALVGEGEVARVVPGLPLKMVMGDGQVAMLPLETAPESITAAAVIHPSSLLVSLRLLFEAMWRQAVPVQAGRHGSAQLPGALALSPLENQVIQLVVAGLTNQAIGRQLGVAERTVQRRIHAVMRSLGVDNRVHLGMRLAQLGWGGDQPLA